MRKKGNGPKCMGDIASLLDQSYTEKRMGREKLQVPTTLRNSRGSLLAPARLLGLSKFILVFSLKCSRPVPKCDPNPATYNRYQN